MGHYLAYQMVRPVNVTYKVPTFNPDKEAMVKAGAEKIQGFLKGQTEATAIYRKFLEGQSAKNAVAVAPAPAPEPSWQGGSLYDLPDQDSDQDPLWSEL
jgi:hypothetical protein